jgi:putative ABC transport system permease protein
VDLVAPSVRTLGQLVYGANNWSTQVQGTTADFAAIRQWTVDKGVFITDSDVRGAAKVCVLGANVAQQLFGDADPLGQTIRIKEIPFRVVGVLTYKGGQTFGGSQDDIVVVPLTTAQRKLMGIVYVNSILCSAVSEAQVNSAVDQITDLMRQRHRIRPGDNDDFFIFTQLEMATAAESTSKVMTLLLASIAAVSLLVGGIGIMNIMLVSVTERTREIGIRMAVGARRRDILLQFIVEALVMAAIGGALGIGIGVASSDVIHRMTEWPVLVRTDVILIAILVSGGVGIFFGFYPARKAARLDPIDALRYE